jgi:hypothetical protein
VPAHSDLCSKHEEAIRRVLAEHESAIRVSWGQSIGERVAPLEAQVDRLVEQFGEPESEVLAADGTTRWDAFLNGETDEYTSELSPLAQAWEEIEQLRGRIDGMVESYSPRPVVRISLRGTESWG